ncbi:MAG: glycosyltransferase family 2 protein [Flavisolibacter sp.]|jgi:glycosyltransferase involved in cell wall biosynthesis|nr:glycosyltransferase family 2 protein [Flavisolibacter sp.]
MNKVPFLSICIPAYNRVHLLKRLLDSISRQSFTDFELIVSDDSEGNEVKELCGLYTHLDLKYFKNDPPAGTPENWNLAIERSSSGWIKLMHDDDWFGAPDALGKFAAAAQKETAHFIFSAYTAVGDEGKKQAYVLTEKHRELLKKNPLYLVYENIIGHPSTVLHKKQSLIRFSKDFRWVVDIDFYIQYLMAHKSFFYLDESLVHIGKGSTQVSESCYKNPDVEIPEYLELINHLGAPAQKDKYVFFSLWNLAKKFRIRENVKIQQHYSGAVPAAMEFIIRYQQKIPHIVLKQTPWSRYFMKKAHAAFANV